MCVLYNLGEETGCQSFLFGQDNIDMQRRLRVVSRKPEVVTKQSTQRLWAVSFTLYYD